MPARVRIDSEAPISPSSAPSSETPSNSDGNGAPKGLHTLLAVVIVDLIGFAIVVPILPFYVDEFGAGGAQLGVIVASFALMQFIAGPMWGRLSDRIGRRPVLLITIAGNTVAMLLLGFADSLATLFAARLLSGTFAGNLGVATAYITDATQPEDRARWMGLIGASFAVGFTLGPLIGGVASQWGYAAPMFVAAALSAVNLIQAVVRLEESPRRATDSGESLSRLGAMKLPGVARLTTTNFVFGFAVTQLETIFALYMLHRFAYDALHVGLILFAMAIVMGGIQGGGMRKLSERYGERTLTLSGAVLLTLGFATVPLTNTVGWLLVPLTLLAVGRALFQPSLMTLVSFQTTDESRGSVMSTFQSAASLARVIGPLLAGVAYDASEGAPFYMAASACIGVLVLSLGFRDAPRPEA